MIEFDDYDTQALSIIGNLENFNKIDPNNNYGIIFDRGS